MINDTTVEPAAFAHDGVSNLRLMNLAWWQVARPCVDWRFLIVKAKGWLKIRKR